MPIPAGGYLTDVSKSRKGPLLAPGGGFFVVNRNGTKGAEIEMAVVGLRCKECGTSTRLTRDTCARSASGPSRSPTTTPPLDAAEARRKIQAGSPSIWRYADFLPFEGGPPATRTSLEPGLTPLVRAERLADRLGLGEVWVKNDAANPTHSFKDRVVGVAVAKARELGSRRSPALPPATWRTPSPRTPPPRGSTPTSSCRATSRSRSCSRPASTAPALSV